MRIFRINNTNITILKNEDIAGYIKKIYASEEMRKITTDGKSFDNVKNNSSMLSQFLVQYAISTGDLGAKSITNISKKFLQRNEDYIKLLNSNCEDKTGKSPKQVLFEDIVVPEITNYWSQKMGMREPLKISDLSKIASIVGLQCKNNKFRTHSFNTAILQEVEENGLDISKELFKDELKALMPIGNQPFKTGVLNTCELSDVSFGYASVVPERVKNILSDGSHKKQEIDETTKEYLTRCVDENLGKSPNLSFNQKEKIKKDSEKIIDFYYGHQSASIAVIKQNESIEANLPNYNINIAQSIGTYRTKPTTSRMFYKFPKEYKEELIEISKMRDSREIIAQLDDVINRFRLTNPEQEDSINDLISYAFGDAICRNALNNFLYINGNGYDIEGGKIDRSEFAIATYQDPAKMFSYYKSMQKKLQTNGPTRPYIKNIQQVLDSQSENC